jgi:hypothetical protein
MKTKIASVGYGLTIILILLGTLGSTHDVVDIAWLFQHPEDWDLVITGFFEGAFWSAVIHYFGNYWGFRRDTKIETG